MLGDDAKPSLVVRAHAPRRGVILIAALGVKIGQVRITPGQTAGRFMVHLALVRSGRPDKSTTGTVALSIDGESAGKATALDMQALTDGKQRELPFNFRYFENLDQE